MEYEVLKPVWKGSELMQPGDVIQLDNPGRLVQRGIVKELKVKKKTKELKLDGEQEL